MEQIHKRTTYQITVAVRAQLAWAGAESGARESGPAVVINLSGGGRSGILRQLPSRDILELTLSTPEGFEESKAAAAWPRHHTFPRQGNPTGAAARRQSPLAGIRAHVVETRVHLENARSTIYAISLAFGRAPGALLSAGAVCVSHQGKAVGDGETRMADIDRAPGPLTKGRRTVKQGGWNQ